MMPAAGATALSWAVALPGAAAEATGRRGPVAPACHVAGAHHSPPRDSRAGESARHVVSLCSPRAQDALAVTRAPGARADRRPRRRDPEVTDRSETRKVSCSCDHLIFV